MKYKYATRQYQGDIIDSARVSVAEGSKAHLIQAGTGSGKSRIGAEICYRYAQNSKRSWFVVPMKLLVEQMDEHFTNIGLPHGLIDAAHEEKRQYLSHVVSSDTLIRRLDNIKNVPDLISFDEAHIALDRQIKIVSKLRETKPDLQVISYTATPELLSGRGLSLKSGGLYESISYSKSIRWMMDRDYLTKLRYMAVPVNGLESLHTIGNDYNEDELDSFLKKNHIYGDMIGHYEKHAKIRKRTISLPNRPIQRINQNYAKARPAFIFCRSVKSAYETAERFRDSGYNFHCIEGNMSKRKRKELIDGLTEGRIDGLTNCSLLTYGVDVPRIEYAASIRPSLSKSLYFQMVGRILRQYENARTGYKKEDTIFSDHVGMISEHGVMTESGLTAPFYLDHIDWNFDGNQKRSRKIKDCFTCKYSEILPGKPLKCLLFGKNVQPGTDGDAKDCPKYTKAGAESLKICINTDCDHYYEHYDGPVCPYCGMAKKRKAQRIEEIDGDLVELAPVPLKDLPPEEKRETQERINSAAALRETDVDKCVRQLLKIADELGYKWMWVYARVVDPEKYMVDMTLLHKINAVLGNKSGYVYYMKKSAEKFHTRRNKENEFKNRQSGGIGGLFE